MHVIVVDHDIDFKGWREAARALVLNNVVPEEITWSVASRDLSLFQATRLPEIEPGMTFNVSAAFVDLVKIAILNRAPERFALLYRMLWRLKQCPDLLEVSTDEDVARVCALVKDVRRDEHKMHAFVRFREFGNGRASRFVAWFEPIHHIVELAAPFFERRFSDIPWSILTPERCVHWDGHRTIFTEGARKADAPSSDPLEDIWRTYYANIFNPARLKIKAMQTEMPRKYWRNLPEASLIDPLILKASRTAQAMIDRDAPEPRASQQRKEETPMAKASAPDNLTALQAEAADCRACPLWKDATQTVFGEGPRQAPIMLVGEQPGDKEDLAGKPFVGPAGQVLNRALEDAGIDREKVYVTNAVKHFKFVPRGKIRLHQKPNTPEIKACRQWYERERAVIQPLLVVAMGATAAQSVFGKITQIGKNRGRLIDLDDAKAMVTVHPSYLLRLPDEDAKEREYAAFVKDLKIAASFLHKRDAA